MKCRHRALESANIKFLDSIPEFLYNFYINILYFRVDSVLQLKIPLCWKYCNKIIIIVVVVVNKAQGSEIVTEFHLSISPFQDGFLSAKRQVCCNIRVLQHSGLQTRPNRDNKTSVQRHCSMRRSFPKVAPRRNGGDDRQNPQSG